MPIAMIDPSCQKQIPAGDPASVALTLTSGETTTTAVRSAPREGGR
jgi:hypothetical protein